jgi:hypothetical protein
MSRIAGTSAELEQLRTRIERWRTSRASQGRMPETLWATAAEVAARHGVSRVASALGLGYEGLKQRVEEATLGRGAPQPEEAKRGFVDELQVLLCGGAPSATQAAPDWLRVGT